MKRSILLSYLIFFSFSVFAQIDNKVTIGTIDTVNSEILKEKRRVLVYLPKESQGDSFEQRYPVVYLLDGEDHFYSVVGMIQQLSQVNGNTVVPEMIVVGITNTNRFRDLTPTRVEPDLPILDSMIASMTGGGEEFTLFLEKELIPHIDTNYPTQSYKLLIGHSLGGLTVMNGLAYHTKLFNSYICLDPSMWWDKMNYLNILKNDLATRDLSGTTLYLGIGNTMKEGMDLDMVKTDTTFDTRHIRAILDMDDYIKNHPPKGLKYSSKYYENDDHGSVPFIAEYDGLRFIFEKYHLRFSHDYYSDTTLNLAAIIDKHYTENVSQIFGYKFLPPEHQINSLGYLFLRMKQMGKAGQLFKMNVENYPNSQNVWDSYGDYFVAIGDKKKAIENFQKALSIKEVSHTREKLNNLQF